MSEFLEGADQEVLVLLKEVAEDPNSRLFRYSPAQVERGVLEEDSRVSLREAGLTLAEREIVRVHREEVARLLVEAARAAFHRTPFGRRWYPGLSCDNEVVSVSGASSSEYRCAKAAGDGHGVDVSVAQLLDQADPNQEVTPEQATQLLGAAARIEGRVSIPFYTAGLCSARAEFVRAEALLRSSLESASGASILHDTLVSLAILAVVRGDLGRGLDLYQSSLETKPGQATGLLGVAGTNLRLGRRPEAASALRHLADLDLPGSVISRILDQQARMWRQWGEEDGASEGDSVEMLEIIHETLR